MCRGAQRSLTLLLLPERVARRVSALGKRPAGNGKRVPRCRSPVGGWIEGNPNSVVRHYLQKKKE